MGRLFHLLIHQHGPNYLSKCWKGELGVDSWARPRSASGESSCPLTFPSLGKISLGEPSRRASIALGLGRSARNEGDRFLQLASLAAQETGLCFLRLEKWTKTVKAVEVGRNHHQGIWKAPHWNLHLSQQPCTLSEPGVEFLPSWCMVAFPSQCGLPRVGPFFVIWNEMMATRRTGLPEGDVDTKLKACGSPTCEVSAELTSLPSCVACVSEVSVLPVWGGGQLPWGSKKIHRLLGLWAEWWERPSLTRREVKPCLVLFLDTSVILLQGHFPYFEVSLSWSSQTTEFSIFRWLGIPLACFPSLPILW